MGDNTNMVERISGNIGFIGAGNMAWAIGYGLINSGLVEATQLYVSAPSNNNLTKWKSHGVNTSNSNGIVVEKSDIVILAVKPHLLDTALQGVENSLRNPVSNKLFVSILAGVQLQVLQQKLNVVVPNSRVIRVMPNTPSMVGAGCSVCCSGISATQQDIDSVCKILSVGGICEMVPEAMMDAVGGLSGCGPAYVYLVIEAMSDGAVMMGVPRALATKYAAQTVMGAAKMVLTTGKHPGQLKDEVCSPGGTTIAGIHSLERSGVRSAFMDAVQSATLKSIELGKK